MIVLLMGAQGAGKGTYGAMLSQKYKIPIISTGNLFREAADKKTLFGIKAKNEYWEKGNLVPDDLTLQILKERISQPDCKKGFFLDGYPRTLNQAEQLEKIAKPDAVIHFVASEKIILGRLGGRIICRNCQKIYHVKNIPPKKGGVCDVCGGELYQREDDTPEFIKVRLNSYWEKTKPVLDYYKNKGILFDMDANPPIGQAPEVIAKCSKILDKIKNTG